MYQNLAEYLRGLTKWQITIVFSIYVISVCQIYAAREVAISKTCFCGQRETKRIIGGKPVEVNEWPWIVALCYDKCSYDTQFCGATLLNDLYVMTAAHCVWSELESGLHVSLGVYNLSSTRQKYVVSKRIQKIIIHEDYDPVSLFNDIALLKLMVPMRFDSGTPISPICLPPYVHPTYANQNAMIIGWGNTKPIGASFPDVLNEATVKVYSHRRCTKLTNYSPTEITTNMMCAAETDVDSCQGDSGGPLMYTYPNGKGVIIGIVSWGVGCASPKYPGIYTRVTKYLDWIKNNTKDATYCRGTRFND